MLCVVASCVINNGVGYYPRHYLLALWILRILGSLDLGILAIRDTPDLVRIWTPSRYRISGIPPFWGYPRSGQVWTPGISGSWPGSGWI